MKFLSKKNGYFISTGSFQNFIYHILNKYSIFLLFLFFVLFQKSAYAVELIQTGDETNFMQGLNLTTVMVDQAILTNIPPAPEIKNNKFDVYRGVIPVRDGNYTCVNCVAYINITKSDIGKKFMNPGECFSYTYENAATLSDGTKADLIVSFSDVNIFVSEYAANSTVKGSANPNGNVIVANGNKLDSIVTQTGEGSWYVGIEEKVTAYVRKKMVQGQMEICYSGCGASQFSVVFRIKHLQRIIIREYLNLSSITGLMSRWSSQKVDYLTISIILYAIM